IPSSAFAGSPRSRHRASRGASAGSADVVGVPASAASAARHTAGQTSRNKRLVQRMGPARVTRGHRQSQGSTEGLARRVSLPGTGARRPGSGRFTLERQSGGVGLGRQIQLLLVLVERGEVPGEKVLRLELDLTDALTAHAPALAELLQGPRL